MIIKVSVFVSLMLILLVSTTVIRLQTNTPPEMVMLEAGKLLTQAQLEKSPKYAKDVFHDAKMYYDSAMAEWNAQNERLIIFRNYTKVSVLAKKSIESGKQSIVIARQTKSNTENILKLKIEKTGLRIHAFEENFGNFPINKNYQDAYEKCKLLYSECLQANKNKNYTVCQSKLDSIDVLLNDVLTHVMRKMEMYLEDHPQWLRMVDQTIAYSKKNQTNALIVDKIARQLIIYVNGKVAKRYTIELGSNWIGDKMQHGDKATPEGSYKIIEKKQNGQTKYQKALLLDYPNGEDKKRFKLYQKNGKIQQNTHIGNLIEIHGSGGRGTDWTSGCIALKDADMNELFKECPLGTKVTIVGSTKALNELSHFLK